MDDMNFILFLNTAGNPMQESSYKSALYGIFRKYNKSNKIPLPKITPHGRVIIRTS